MRRLARKCAMQLVYQLDMQQALCGAEYAEDTVQQALRLFWQTQAQETDKLTLQDKAYTQRVVCGIAQHVRTMDNLLAQAAHNWRPERMMRAELAIVRVAVYEMLWEADIARAVAIDEAIRLGKEFGGPQAAAFINGVLDAIQPAGVADASKI